LNPRAKQSQFTKAEDASLKPQMKDGKKGEKQKRKDKDADSS
jgi:hypothetical protein